MPPIRFTAFGTAKTLSKIFGLATMACFGRMPSRDDDQLAHLAGPPDAQVEVEGHQRRMPERDS